MSKKRVLDSRISMGVASFFRWMVLAILIGSFFTVHMAEGISGWYENFLILRYMLSSCIYINASCSFFFARFIFLLLFC